MWKNERLQDTAPLVYIFLAALAVRLIYVVFFFGLKTVPDPDSPEYLNYALNLVSGFGYTDGHWRVFRAPGYPFFIAAVYTVFGQAVATLKVAQTVISALVPVLVCLIGYKVTSRRAAIISGFFACFYFGLVDEPARILSEAVFTFLFALSILLLLNIQKHKAYAAAAGAAIALTALARPVGLLLGPLAILWLAAKLPARETLKAGALGLLTFLAVMSPWWARNYRVFDRFIPVCLETGFVLKHSHVPEAQRNFHNDLPELERDRLNLKEGIDFIKTQKTSLLLKNGTRSFLQLLYPFMPVYDLTYAIIFPFWLLGVYFIFRKKNITAYLLFVMFLYFPVAFAFFGTPRYRHSMGPYFILIAAIAVEAMAARIKTGKQAAAAGAALVLWLGLNILVFIYSEPLRLLVKKHLF